MPGGQDLSRFDRYMLSQLMTLFGFFSLVLVSIYWVNRAVSLFDRLIANGQSIGVFFEFTILSLPAVIELIFPIACFAAATYVTNRLSSESELVVMQSTGFSPWRLARPVLNFGLITAVMMAALSLYLVPNSMTKLEEREREIAENATARLLTEGTFLHPSEDVTLYIREITSQGILQDLFLSDHSDPEQFVTYTAQEAYLIKDETGPKLIMVDGMAQVQVTEDQRLFTTNFADFTYDISSFLQYGTSQSRTLERTPTLELMQTPKDVAENLGLELGWVYAELHGRMAQVLICIVASLIGFATLLLGGFSRFGVWQQIVLAFALLVFIEAMRNGVTSPVQKDPSVWYLMYVPGLVGLGIAALMLASKTRASLWRKRAPA